MKKALALIMAIVMMATMSACGSKASVLVPETESAAMGAHSAGDMMVPLRARRVKSTVAFSDLEKAIAQIDDDAELTFEETEDGYSFSFEMKNYMTVLGTTDENEMVQALELRQHRTDYDYFMSMTNEEAAYNILNWKTVPMNRVLATLALVNFNGYIAPLLKNETETSIDSTREGLTTDTGWEISISGDEEESTVSIHAVFVG